MISARAILWQRDPVTFALWDWLQCGLGNQGPGKTNMKWEIVERKDRDENGYQYWEYPVFAGPFNTRAEADAEKNKRQPKHGGDLVVKPVGTAKKAPSKAVSRRRGTRRDSRRR